MCMQVLNLRALMCASERMYVHVRMYVYVYVCVCVGVVKCVYVWGRMVGGYVPVCARACVRVWDCEEFEDALPFVVLPSKERADTSCLSRLVILEGRHGKPFPVHA